MMNDWDAWRIAIVVAAWLTVAGGLLMGTLWAVFGGLRAAGPEDEMVAVAGVHPHRAVTKQTSFSAATVTGHAMAGILTASFITWAATRDQAAGYIGVLLLIAVTAIPGVVMYLRWRRGERPVVRGVDRQPRVEDRLPKVAVYGHGLLVAVTTVLAVILLMLA
jgi:hypothetical protein